MPPKPKVSRNDLHDVLQNKCTQNISQDRILVTVGSLQSDLILDKEIDVTRKTIREKGICPAGYFQKKYPGSVSYKTDGSPESRGMVIQPKQFLIDTGKYESKEELAENFEKIRVCEICEEFFNPEKVERTEDSIICNNCHDKALDKAKKMRPDMFKGEEE